MLCLQKSTPLVILLQALTELTGSSPSTRSTVFAFGNTVFDISRLIVMIILIWFATMFVFGLCLSTVCLLRPIVMFSIVLALMIDVIVTPEFPGDSSRTRRPRIVTKMEPLVSATQVSDTAVPFLSFTSAAEAAIRQRLHHITVMIIIVWASMTDTTLVRESFDGSLKARRPKTTKKRHLPQWPALETQMSTMITWGSSSAVFARPPSAAASGAGASAAFGSAEPALPSRAQPAPLSRTQVPKRGRRPSSRSVEAPTINASAMT